MNSYRQKSEGAISGQIVAIFGLLLLAVVLSGALAWLYVQYDDQKTNVESKISLAEAEARKLQAEEDEERIRAIEETPHREFSGPEDHGSVSFEYPKNWSAYIAKLSDSGNDRFVAYLHPVVVPVVGSGNSRFALKVGIYARSYDQVLSQYQSRVASGDLTSESIKVNNHTGTRFDGEIESDIVGSAVAFKVRDKTLVISTESELFKKNFDELVETIDFNE